MKTPPQWQKWRLALCCTLETSTSSSPAYYNESHSADDNRYLKVVCLMRGDSFEAQPLVEYNMEVFQCALENVFDVGE